VDGVPAYLDAFVARATARRRDLRPADAHVMLQQLRRVRHAYDSGISADDELTEDLTPTLAIPPDGDEHRALRPQPDAGDEVFDIAAYDDFAERTLVVGHDTLENPLQDGPLPLAGSAAAPPVAAPRAPLAVPREEQRHPIDPGKPRRRRRAWIATILVLLLTAAAGLGGWWFGVARFQSTPDVVRMSQGDARSTLQDAGLAMEISQTSFSETVPQGYVISTEPGPGDRVLDDGTVEAIVSKGPERYDVPDLTGMSESEAITALGERNLDAVVTRRVWSEQHAEGQVMSFAPRPGTELKRGDPVTMVVSKGPEPIRVPDYEGKDAATATEELSALGLTVRPTEAYDDDVPAGIVIRQSPDHGVRYQDDVVRLVVSRGPHLVEVPRVISYGEEAAREALADAGFEVDFQEYEPNLGFHIVADQSPGAGEMAPFGSTIVVYLI
jgi:serine/threonine-protein kinase